MMPARQAHQDSAAASSNGYDQDQESWESPESRPLLRPLTGPSTTKLCVASMVSALVVLWCVLDTWNREVLSQLFGMSEIKNVSINPFTGEINGDINRFDFPLTLALVQFTFMGLAFLALWLALCNDARDDLQCLKDNIWDMRWLWLVLTHIFGTFWLQALIMPFQMMSLGVWAFCRALEVPVAAVLRSKVLSDRSHVHAWAAVLLMFLAAWLLSFSHTNLAGCMMIWSGHGVALTGVAFYMIYALVLVAPAVNCVCQEAVLVRLKVHPFLMLGVMNMCSALIFVAVVYLAYLAQWEDVSMALHMFGVSSKIEMSAVWLCVQMSSIAAVGLALITVVGSFWSVALRSLIVVWWWCQNLLAFYLYSDVLLSIANPSASLWSFVMFCGLVMTAVAMVVDGRLGGPLRAKREAASSPAGSTSSQEPVNGSKSV